MVELPKNRTLNEGFQLEIGLAEIHVPRMWVERDGDSQVTLFFNLCSLTLTDSHIFIAPIQVVGIGQMIIL